MNVDLRALIFSYGVKSGGVPVKKWGIQEKKSNFGLIFVNFYVIFKKILKKGGFEPRISQCFI